MTKQPATTRRIEIGTEYMSDRVRALAMLATRSNGRLEVHLESHNGEKVFVVCVFKDKGQ